jgi:hypothetical protein
MAPKEMAPSDPARSLIQFHIPTGDTAGAFQAKYLASLSAASPGFCQHEKGNWTQHGWHQTPSRTWTPSQPIPPPVILVAWRFETDHTGHPYECLRR